MKKQKICLIDDEPFIVEMYSKKLTNEGFEVIAAYNGEEGLKKIKETRPEIILVDLIMPKKSGFELMRELRSDSEFSKIPIVVLTNIDDPKKRTLACKLGALFFIIKSQCMPAELTKIVKEILEVTLNNPEKNLTCSK